MVGLEKLVNEFIFLREKLREIATLVIKNENIEAAFLVGALHTVCHNHIISIGQLLPVKPIEEKKDDAMV